MSNQGMKDDYNSQMGGDQAGDEHDRTGHLVIHAGKPHRLQVKISIPVKEHPQFNFVGKLLGPKGSSLKQLQEVTQTRMAILGRGSMRDKKKEEELRSKGEPKYAHLNDELHVEVSAFAPPSEAYRRVAHAIDELARFLTPDYSDDMRQYQMQDMGMNGGRPNGGRPNGGRPNGGRPNGGRPGPGMNQGPPGPAGYGYEEPVAAPHPPPPGPPSRGQGYWAGTAPTRGAAAPRRGAMPPPRGAPQAARRPAPQQVFESQYEDPSYGRYDAPPAARSDYYGEVPVEEAPDFAVDEYAAEPRPGGGPVRAYPRGRPYAGGARPY